MDKPINGSPFGDHLGECFGLRHAPSFALCPPGSTPIAVTQIRCDDANNGLTAPIPVEDAFLVTLQLRDCPSHDLWLAGRPQATGVLAAGTTCIYDLRREPMVNSVSPFHNLHFYLPRRSLNELREKDGGKPLDTLIGDPGCGTSDPVLGGLGAALLPAFERPDEVMQIFVDHIIISFASYLASAYGTTRPPRPRRTTITFTPVQERRAKEMLTADLHGDISMIEIADALDMSVPVFQRSFQAATGRLPHQWLLEQRIDRATDLLRRSRRPVGEVALAAGFADERHLRRVIEHNSGQSPEDIRRAN